MNWREIAIAAYRQEQEEIIRANQERRRSRRLNAEARLSTLLGSKVVVNDDMTIGADLLVEVDSDEQLSLSRICPRCGCVMFRRLVKKAGDIGGVLNASRCPAEKCGAVVSPDGCWFLTVEREEAS